MNGVKLEPRTSYTGELPGLLEGGRGMELQGLARVSGTRAHANPWLKANALSWAAGLMVRSIRAQSSNRPATNPEACDCLCAFAKNRDQRVSF